jgi:hypothetical protein
MLVDPTTFSTPSKEVYQTMFRGTVRVERDLVLVLVVLRLTEEGMKNSFKKPA